MKFIKIYGLNRSGTNYVEWLMRHNFKDTIVLYDSNVLGWKHGEPIPLDSIDWTGDNWDDPQIPHGQKRDIIHNYMQQIRPYKNQLIEAVANNEVIFIFCYKHPYSWYSSFDRQSNRRKLADPINVGHLHLWNERNNQFLDFYNQYNDNCFQIKYEDFYFLEEGYKTILTQFQSKFGLERINNETWANQVKRLDPRQKVLNQRFDAALYYAKEEFYKTPTEDQKKMFKNRLDSDLLEKLGYTL